MSIYYSWRRLFSKHNYIKNEAGFQNKKEGFFLLPEYDMIKEVQKPDKE